MWLFLLVVVIGRASRADRCVLTCFVLMWANAFYSTTFGCGNKGLFSSVTMWTRTCEASWGWLWRAQYGVFTMWTCMLRVWPLVSDRKPRTQNFDLLVRAANITGQAVQDSMWPDICLECGGDGRTILAYCTRIVLGGWISLSRNGLSVFDIWICYSHSSCDGWSLFICLVQKGLLGLVKRPFLAILVWGNSSLFFAL